jgi:hypothetical protein
MSYPWALPQPDPALDEALDIAIVYLEATGQAKAADDAWHVIADSIFTTGLQGTRHKIGWLTSASWLPKRHPPSHRVTGNLRLRDLTLP